MDRLSPTSKRSLLFPSLRTSSANLRKCEWLLATSSLCALLGLILIIRGGGWVLGSPWMALPSAAAAIFFAIFWYKLRLGATRVTRLFSELTYFSLTGFFYFFSQVGLTGNESVTSWWIGSLAIPLIVVAAVTSLLVGRMSRISSKNGS